MSVSDELYFSGLCPILYSSPVDLQSDCQLICDIIKDNTQQWDKRIENLKKIVRIAQGNTYESQFLSILNKQLRDPIVANLHDLRSAVVRDACICVCMLCTQYGDTPDINTFADYIVPQLFKLLVGAAVIATTGDRAIKCIVGTNKLNKSISKICESCYSLDNKIRTACIQYMLQVIETQAHYSDFTRHSDIIEKCIKDKLGDKSDSVRVTARQCYIQYSESSCRSRALVLWDTFDEKTKKLINDERSNKGLSSYTNRPSRSVSAASNSSTQSRRESIKSTFNATTPTPAVRYSMPQSFSNNGSFSSSSESTPELHNRAISDTTVITTHTARLQTSQSYTTQPSVTHHRLGVPMRVLSAAVAPVKSMQRKHPSITTSDLSSTNSSHPTSPTSTLSDSAVLSSGVDSAVNVARSNSMQSFADTDLSSKPPSSKRVSVSNINNNTSSRPQSSMTQRPQTQRSNSDLQVLIKYLESAKSSDWSERVSAFTSMCSLFNHVRDHTNTRTDTQVHIDKIMTAHLDKSNDPHIKVATAAINSLHALLSMNQCTVDDIKPYIERLLPCLFNEASNKQLNIVELSKQCLHSLTTSFTADYLIITIVRLTDGLNIKCKYGCIEYITSIIAAQSNTSNTIQSNDVKRLIGKLIHYIHDMKHKTVRDISVQCLYQLHCHTQFSAMVSMNLSALTSTDYSTILRTISNINLQFANQLIAQHTQQNPNTQINTKLDNDDNDINSMSATHTRYESEAHAEATDQFTKTTPVKIISTTTQSPVLTNTHPPQSYITVQAAPLSAVEQSTPSYTADKYVDDCVLVAPMSPLSPNSRYLKQRNLSTADRNSLTNTSITYTTTTPTNQSIEHRAVSTPMINPILSAYYNSLTSTTTTLLMAVKQLNVAIRDNNIKMDKQFDRLHTSLISLTTDGNDDIRDAALQGILTLVRHKAYTYSQFNTHAVDSFNAIIALARTQANASQPCNSTETVLITLCELYSCTELFSSLIQSLNSIICNEHHEAVLKISLNTLIAMINRCITHSQLMTYINDMVASLSQCVTNGGQNSVVVRKLSINTFVALYSVIGDTLFEYTQPLNMVTTKLVHIYCDKYRNDSQRQPNIVA